ncbi:tail fiber protein [Xenorhabdus bovienii]|nr:tail fiber protein [Xenorhabdus bovienii]
MEKNQNGADIPNKNEFVKNLGLAETVNLAKNSAQQDWVRDNFAKGNYFSVNVTGDYPRINFYPPNKENDFLSFEASLGGSSSSIYLYRRNRQGKNIYLVEFPSKSGILATTDDIANINNIPVGIPLPWPQETPPPGYLICNGERFDKSKCPQLALAYPSGVLPDLRGEFIRGWDNERGVDTAREVLSWQEGSYLVQEIYNPPDNVVNFSLDERKDLNWDIPDKEVIKLRGRTVTADKGGTWNIDKRYLGVTRPRNIAFNYIVRAA